MDRLTCYNAYFDDFEIDESIDTNKFTDKDLKGKDLGECIIFQLGRFEQLCYEYGIKNFDELVKIVRKAKGE